AAEAVVRRSDRRRTVQGGEDRPPRVRRHALALLRDLQAHRRRTPAARVARGAGGRAGLMITVRLPESLRDGRGSVVTMNAASLDDIIGGLELAGERDELYNFAVNGELIVHGEHGVRLADGDEVEIVIAFSG